MSNTNAENLMPRGWHGVDSAELRLLLAEVFGEPGQYDGVHKHRLYLPLGGKDARVVLDYKGPRIVRISKGPAFNAREWQAFADEVEGGLLAGPIKVGREISFADQPVQGSWRGETSGLQILPPPEGSPLPPYLMAAHPFVLEFPLRETSRWPITNHRRLRLHERLTNLLNVLLPRRFNVLPRRPEHLWAGVQREDGSMQIQWVQELYFAKIGPAVQESLSKAAGTQIVQIDPSAYFSVHGNDGQPLRLPSGLDQQIARYQTLPSAERVRFDRAAYWVDMASRQWTVSTSLSFAALVAAIEALTDRDRGVTHTLQCVECKKAIPHEAPGPTERFREFLERYAPGATRQERSDMYALRSGILHGSSLMGLDYDVAHGWDPPWWNERELHWALWRLTSTAIRSWLETTAAKAQAQAHAA